MGLGLLQFMPSTTILRESHPFTTRDFNDIAYPVRCSFSNQLGFTRVELRLYVATIILLSTNVLALGFGGDIQYSLVAATDVLISSKSQNGVRSVMAGKW